MRKDSTSTRRRQYNEMQQRRLRPLPPTLPSTSSALAAAAVTVASVVVHSYPPQFYFGWGPHYGQQQGWWPPSHPALPAPPLMAYSSSAAAINSTSDSINVSAAATASIAPPPQRQKNMDFSFSKMPKSQQVHTRKRRMYVLDAPKITGGKIAMHIPVEVMIEILAKLPTRALLRFKSLCKSWHSTIQDRHFISRHLQNNRRRSSCGLNFISLPRPFEFYLCCFIKDVKDWHGFEIRGSEKPPTGYRISNSCDGLICVYTSCRTYVVNPRIRDVLELPIAPDQQTLWALKDYSNNRWTKQFFNLEMMESMTDGLAAQFKLLALRDGKIMTSNRRNRLDFYDPVTGCFDKPRCLAHRDATAYIESLISPTEIQNSAMRRRFPESDRRVGCSAFTSLAYTAQCCAT